MILKLRYENTFEEIKVDLREMELWLNISCKSEESITERERLVQDKVEELLNRPEYNNWHKMDRHRGIPKKTYRKDDQDADDTDGMAYLEDTSYTRMIEEKESYNAICSEIRLILIKKPEWAAAVIAVYINGEPIREYSTRIGVNENTISQKLKRAKKKLKEYFENRKIL